jgi:hypothetical protein
VRSCCKRLKVKGKAAQENQFLCGCFPKNSKLFSIARPLLAIAGQGCLGAFLLPGFQVEGMSLDLLDEVRLLDLPLKSPKRAFQGFSFLDVHFRQ